MDLYSPLPGPPLSMLHGVRLRLPQRGIKNVGVGRIEGDVDAAALRILIEDLLPGLAAILRAEDAALFVIGKGMTQRSDEGDVRILRIDDHASDGMGVRQADELPRRACVNRFINSVAADNVAANASFAGSDINDVRVRLRDGNRADRRGHVFCLVGQRLPVQSAVRGLPYAAGSGAEVIHIRLTHYTRDVASTRPPRYGPTSRY